VSICQYTSEKESVGLVADVEQHTKSGLSEVLNLIDSDRVNSSSTISLVKKSRVHVVDHVL